MVAATISMAAGTTAQMVPAKVQGGPSNLRRTPERILGLHGLQRGLASPEVAKFMANWKVPAPVLSKPARFGGLSSPMIAAADSDNSNRLLVVYDHWSDYKFIGELYARQMRDLLSGLGYGIDLVPVESYQAGMINDHRATFYMGVFYDTALPTSFTNDVLSAQKPVCWTGYNLWKIAWTPDYGYKSSFENQYGFRFLYIDDGFSSVVYKSKTLGKDATETMRLKVLNTSKATVLAQAKGNGTIPYILKSGNLWVVNDNPIEDVVYAYQNKGDRTLAFCDVVHDIVNDGAPEIHRATVRIEDVSPAADPAALRKVADILAAENVPFVVSTIPFYRDPLGYWNYGTPYELKLQDSPAVISALKYMESKGGQIIQHGTTHQYGDIPNPNYGVSGDDWEFFRLVNGTNGDLIPYGPVWEDSPEWVADRVTYGQTLLANAGFAKPKGWLTPHYLASPIDYKFFADNFEYSMCHAVHFSTDAAGYLYWQDLFAPWPIKDEYGTVRLPETVNYLSDSEAGLSVANMVGRAKSMLVVRDGWAGMYFHPYLSPNLLKQAVRQIKAQGFTFVAPSAAYAPAPK